MRMVIGMLILVACALTGCNSQAFEVAYPDAVATLTSYYPTIDTSEMNAREIEDRTGGNPAYSDEGGGSPWGMTVNHGESDDDREFRILIEKHWESATPRLTAITIKQETDYHTVVTVTSERGMAIGGYVWDMSYESARLDEIRQLLTPLERQSAGD
jgi:hypothetical protein